MRDRLSPPDKSMTAPWAALVNVYIPDRISKSGSGSGVRYPLTGELGVEVSIPRSMGAMVEDELIKMHGAVAK